MKHIADFSGNETDPVRANGKVMYWRAIVRNIIERVQVHSDIILNTKKKERGVYTSSIIESCMLSIGALSILVERDDDEFSFGEKLQARTIILESLNLCAKLDKIKRN
jgi:hypothetical protein